MPKTPYLAALLVIVCLSACQGVGAAQPAAVSAPYRSTTDMVVIDPAHMLRMIPAGFFGINYTGFWDDAQGSPASARALKQTPIRTVRFPGGVPADYYDWQDPYYKGWSRTSPLDLWRYARSFGADHVVFGTNFQGNIPNPPGKSYSVNSPENAAAWTAYNEKTGIKADMEVGNEEDLKLLQKLDDPAYTQYLQGFNGQARAMHQANPRVHVVGPVGVNEYYWWSRNGLADFLRAAGNRTGTGQVDAVSLHFYKGSSWEDAKGIAQYWLSPTGPWAAVQKAIKQHDTRKLRVYMTEWNLGASDSNNAFTPTLGHALAVADMLGAFARSGVAGEDYYTTHYANGWGLLYGPGEDRPLDTPTPTYYAMALWGHMGNRVIASQQNDDPAGVISSYATSQKGGAIQVLAINKRPTSQKLSIMLQGRTPAGHALRAYTLTSKSGGVDDKDARYNGLAVPSPQKRLPGPKNLGTVRGRTISYTVPPYSAVVLYLSGTSPAPHLHWKPSPAAAPLPPLAVTATGKVGQAHVRPGDTQQLQAVVQANDDLGSSLVDLEVHDGSGQRVFQGTETVNIAAGKAVTVTKTYQLSASAYGGTYVYKVGAFGPNWSSHYAWNDHAATFRVDGPPPPKIGVTGTADPQRVRPGDTVTLTAAVSASGNNLTQALVDLEVYSPSGGKVCQQFKDGVNVPKEGSAKVTEHCVIPHDAASGTYVLKTGVFGPNWSPLYLWTDRADTFIVGP